MIKNKLKQCGNILTLLTLLFIIISRLVILLENEGDKNATTLWHSYYFHENSTAKKRYDSFEKMRQS